MKTYTDSQLKKGGKQFAFIVKNNPEASPEQLAEILGEPVEKIQARLESRKNFIAARKAEHQAAAERVVQLPAPERETEKGICFKMEFACEGYGRPGAGGDYETRTQAWLVWFPKSQLGFIDGQWSCPGWLFDRKIAESAADVEARKCGRMGNWQTQKCTGLVDGEIIRWNKTGIVHDQAQTIVAAQPKTHQN